MPCETKDCSSLIQIESGDTSATIHPFGATVVSWKVNGEEKLFVSSKAIWDGSKPIRGGIPIVFPQFGTGPIMTGQHGFVRNQYWQVEKVSPDKAIARLSENEKTFDQWPHRFTLALVITVKEGELTVEMQVDNPTDSQDGFNFTALLHTYHNVGDISTVKVKGFSNCLYMDKLKSGAEGKEESDTACINGEVDRNFLSIPDRILLSSIKGEVEIIKSNFPDVVFWNPWIEKAKSMADFDDEDYKQMVCIEPGQVATPITLSPGQTWKASQILRSL